ncbi:MAG: beta strand repeat-containing protein [Moraxellaceae bacterium]
MMRKVMTIGISRLLLLFLLLPLTAQADRNFSQRFSANTEGDLVLVGNTLLSCPTAATNCAAARAGGAYDNNDFNPMAYVDIDSDATTFNSSSANLTIPAGSTVLFAGLYWSGDSSSSARNQVLFKTASAFGYSTVTASVVDQGATGAAGTAAYQGYANVTSQVQAAGSGTYTVANVQAGTARYQHAGWSLIVVFSNNSYPLRNFAVYDGMRYAEATTINIPVSGFLTPLSGPITTRLGTVVYDGDVGTTGDAIGLNSTTISDAVHPANNAFNSKITDLGVNVTSKNPDYRNQLGFDLARWNVPSGIMPNGATTATINVTSPTGGSTPEVMWVGVITFSTDIYVPIITPNIVKTATDVNGGQLVAGDTLRWTVTMSNTGLDTATNLTVTDPLPPEVTYKTGTLKIVTAPAGATTGTKTDTAGDDVAEYISGSNSVVFRLGTGATSSTGGSLAYGQSTSFTFDTIVAGGLAAGTPITNTVSVSYRGQTIGETYGGTGAAASAVLMGPPAISKAFAPAAIDVGGVSVLSIVVSNPASNPATLSGVTFTDTYPAGLLNAASPNPAINCTPGSTAGTLTGGAANGGDVGMSGASIAANGNCTITINVTAATAGSYSNITSTVASNNGGTGPASAAAVLAVGKPSIAKAFAPTSILSGANSVITFTLSNPTAAARSGVGFTDTLTNMVVSTPSVTGGTCTGTRTALQGTNSISFSGGSLAASGSCTVTVSVTSTTGGIHPNTSTGVSSTETGAAGNPSNTAYLTVIAPPAISKSFSPTSVRTNSPSQMTITVSNPNTTGSITGIAFTDTYPTTPGAMINDAPPNSTLNCTGSTGGTVEGRTGAGAWGTVVASQTAIRMTGLTLAAGGSCTITVNVDGATAGNYTNSTGAVSSTNAGSGAAASAVLNITSFVAPTVTKTFGGSASSTVITSGSNTMLRITLANSNASAVTGAAFTDTFPTNLFVANTPAVTNTCAVGTLSGATAGSSSLTLSGATIPASSSCYIEVSVTSSDPGEYLNTTGTITTTNAGSFGPATAILNVLAPPKIAKAFNPTSIGTGAAAYSTLTITLSNPTTASVSLSGVAFNDAFPANMIVHTTPSAATTCASGTIQGRTGGGGWGTIASLNTEIRLTGATLAPNASCTVSVRVRSSSTTPATYVNTTGNVTSSNGGTGLTATASMSISRPAIAKTFSAGATPIAAGASTVLTITLSNPGSAAMAGAAFTDTYPAGMTNTATPSAATTCGGTVTAAANGGSIALSGGSIPAASSCTVTVNVRATETVTNTIPAGELSTTSYGDNASPASATLQIYNAPDVLKVFSPDVVLPSGNSRLTITLTNSNALAASGVAFTDNYPSGLVNAPTPAAANTCSPAGTLTATAGGTSFVLTGAGIPANSSCSVSVDVRSATAGAYLNNSGSVATSNIGTGAASSATLTVMAVPTLTKVFTPAAVLVNEESVLTITLSNANALDVMGAALTDTYPSGLVNTATPSVTSSCADAVLSATAGGNSVAISGATIPAAGSCTLSVRVKSAAAGSYNNTTGTVSTSNAGTGAAASATLTVTAPQPALNLMKLVSVFSDPVNGGSNPKSIPGAISAYTIRLTNAGQGTVDANPAAPAAPTFVVSDPLPAEVDLFVGDIGVAGSGPFIFTNGSPSSGLSCTYTSLASNTDCVEFSANGSTWMVTPTPDANGFDSAIRYIRFRPSGSMSGASGGNPYAEFQFRVRVK